MGVSKTDLFTKQQNDIAIMAKALGHPARIAILQHLVKVSSCVCGDMVEQLGLAQATTSQHLKELKKAGLITGTIEGANVCYCIDPNAWKQYRQVFAGFFKDDVNTDRTCC